MGEADQPVDCSKIFVDAYLKLPKETYELFTRSADVYTKLYRTWYNSSEHFSKGKLESQELHKVWANNFKDIYNNVFEMLFRPMKITAGSPWTDTLAQMGDLTRGSWPVGAFGSLQELFKPYESLMYLYPKEILQLFSKVVNAYANFSSAWAEYNSRFYKAWNEASEKLSSQFAEKMVNLQKDSEKPIGFMDFYDLWQETFSKTYVELLSLPDMVSVQTRLSSSMMDLIKYWRDFIEAIISTSPAFPLPTKSEMDDVYKKLHLLEKEIDEINKKVEGQRTRVRQTPK